MTLLHLFQEIFTCIFLSCS
ncbi:unnamed protein product [Spirodela intermedia]|uniref:Uncharacterized protein n=1 Tax=Spirodela intermedia TaxID=51605 RepID=A0A7I8L6E3_SPIIN|nr:unnamed protein product [Spirodela intermedia]